MKTLVLATASVAALLVAGVASAQTVSGNLSNYDAALVAARSNSTQTSYTSQTGVSNSANIEQIAGANSNESSTVIQYWPSNYSDSYAAAGDHAANNSASVYQAGSNAQRAVVMQQNYGSYDGNGASVTQRGKGKLDALSYQLGNKNYSTITQDGNGSSNDGFQVKTVDDHANGEAVAQSLQSQDAALQQYPQGGARIVQDESTGSVASINQTNASSDAGATIEQWHAYKDSASVTQTAQGDRSASYQNGHDNYINVGQSGNGDLAVTVQVGEGSGSGASDMTYSNYASVSQSGNGDQALSRQAGNNNSLTLAQSGTDDGSAIDQAGSMQVGYVTQAGSYDSSSLKQHGTTDVATIKQYGTSDVSIVDQTGTGGLYNTANITQTSNGAWSQAIQSGYGNIATVYQH